MSLSSNISSFFLKNRDITLPTKVCRVKAMLFPVVMYGCESWTIKKAIIYLLVTSRVQLFAIPWTIAHQVPMSMEFSRQEYWSGLPFPSPGDLPNSGISLGKNYIKPKGNKMKFFNV